MILGVEWFYNHPALRYGGYCIIALLIFIPICLKLDISNVNYKYYIKSVIILLILTALVFNIRNINRIVKEINFYKYKPLQETFYNLDSNIFRIQKQMKGHISRYNKCLNSREDCSPEGQKVYMKYGKIIFNNRVND